LNAVTHTHAFSALINLLISLLVMVTSHPMKRITGSSFFTGQISYQQYHWQNFRILSVLDSINHIPYKTVEVHGFILRIYVIVMVCVMTVIVSVTIMCTYFKKFMPTDLAYSNMLFTHATLC